MSRRRSPSHFVGSLFGSVKGLFKRDSEHRAEVKQVLKKYPGTLLQSVNELLQAADELLGDRALLVVIDNLDRYDPEVIDKLLVAGADRIRELRCNLILTPPIGLMLRPRSALLDAIYSCHMLLHRPPAAASTSATTSSTDRGATFWRMRSLVVSTWTRSSPTAPCATASSPRAVARSGSCWSWSRRPRSWRAERPSSGRTWIWPSASGGSACAIS